VRFERENAHIVRNINNHKKFDQYKSFSEKEIMLIRENEKFPLGIQNQIIENVMKLSQTLLASKLIPEKRNHSQGFTASKKMM
jgi:hypothetical protein